MQIVEWYDELLRFADTPIVRNTPNPAERDHQTRQASRVDEMLRRR